MALPKFDAPPVVEVVLSAQFSRLKTHSVAYAGWFWKEYLGNPREWPQAMPMPRIPDQFERFDDSGFWAQASLSFAIPQIPERLQILRKDQQRIIQLQDSRFLLNWRKQGGSQYPNYEQLAPEFHNYFEKFQKYCHDIGNQEPLELNQWEVTYLNYIEKGTLWNSVNDWQEIFRELRIPGANRYDVESMQAEWRYLIPPNKGRLYVSIKHGRVGSPTGPESLILQLVARGHANLKEGTSLEDGFNLGHETIVTTFDRITSDRSHKIWKRKEEK